MGIVDIQGGRHVIVFCLSLTWGKDWSRTYLDKACEWLKEGGTVLVVGVKDKLLPEFEELYDSFLSVRVERHPGCKFVLFACQKKSTQVKVARHPVWTNTRLLAVVALRFGHKMAARNVCCFSSLVRLHLKPVGMPW